MTIIAAADGSALGNPGPMGWAWYVDDERWGAGGAPHGTNNQGELMAVLELLRSTAGSDEALHVECDSRYVIDALTRWMPGWKRKGWRKADGKPVLNRDLLEQLDEALAGRSIEFEWVKGHAGHPRNEAADARANAAAVAFQRGAAPAAGPGFGDAVGSSAAAAAPATAPAASEPDALLAPDAPDAADAEPTLFDDLDDEPVQLTIALTPDEDARLRARASEAGMSPEELLRTLI